MRGRCRYKNVQSLEFSSIQRNHVRGFTSLSALVSFSLLLISCGGSDGSASQSQPVVPPQVTYTAKSGVAQKGPLIKGSTVTAQELGSNLSPTGKQYSYQTTTDLGTFSPTSTFGSQYIGLIATGYYFDEVANAVSSGTITLDGYSDLAVDSILNVNLLTTLEYQRIQNLVTQSNMTFVAARTQAEREVLTALNIPAGSYGSFDTLDLSGGTDGDQILAAISSIFVYGNSSGPLSSLIANFQSDIGANGVISSSATKTALAAAAKAINPAVVAANLTQEYSSVGVVFTAANISDWIDQDGDGVVGKFKFQVADATPSSVFTFPTFVVTEVAGTSVSVTAGQLSVNGIPASGAVSVSAGDTISVSPGAGAFPNGVMTSYLLTGGNKIARVSFVSGLLSIAVTPSSPSIPNGLTLQFTATGTFSDTSTSDLTNVVQWTSGTPAIATLGTTSGLASSLAVGSSVITATSGLVSGSSTLSVTPAIAASISIAPNPAFSGVGLPLQLTATATYSDGTTANVTNVASWTSSAPSIATVGPTTGQTIAIALGSTTISATIGALTTAAPLSVVTNMWSLTGSLSVQRVGHTATLLPNGKVLVAGGADLFSGSGSVASAELYDPVAGTWSLTGSLSVPRFGHTATLLPNGMVLVAGGGSAATELYDPVAGTWSSTSSMSVPRTNHTATLLLNGNVLVTGGYNNSQGSPFASAEIYDPVAGTWSLTGSMSVARDLHTATLLPNGKVLVAGGTNFDFTFVSAELYDPVAGIWSLTGSLSTARSGHTATLLPSGMVLVAGGTLYQIQPNGPITATAELYDPAAGTWATTGSLATPRSAHTATLLPNGTVLAAGGDYNPDTAMATATAELYDPVAGTWSGAANLSTSRYEHTATLLPDGAVLAVGGVTTVGEIINTTASAELYW